MFEFGQPARHFYLIKQGQVTLYRPSYSGEDTVFRCLAAGDFLADATMFIEGAVHPVSARVTVDSTIYKIAQTALLDICQSKPELTLRLLGSMAVTITQAVNRIDLLTMTSTGQRLAAYLLDLYVQHKSVQFSLPASQLVLAGQLNLAPETFSRQLRQFRQAGFISGETPIIILNDIAGLCRALDLPLPVLDPHSPTQPENTLGKGLVDCCNHLKTLVSETGG